jgi:cytochrome d ubiquinol oxidase subunit I
LEALEIARWQFGITTVYHFMMVPLTIGLGLVVAVMQTIWNRTANPAYLRMTKFWGKLFLINFIMGVATGIVQEFQFGMAWSEYSRFVGDVFGAPLALEALLAFFVESTFLGLWIFGWKQLKQGVHLACLWIAVVGSFFSAYFIIVANSWMQHPVGVTMIDGRPVMTDAWAVFTNNTALVAVPHTLFGALAVAGGSCWASPGTTSGAGAATASTPSARTARWWPARPRSRAATAPTTQSGSSRCGSAPSSP